MLALQKTLDSSWEIARVSLRQDLDTIQTVLNRRWGATFGASNTLSVSSISGAAALARVNDTNITLTLSGSPTVSLLAATTITVGWAGTLAAGRLNSNVVQGITNDTNVTGSIAAQVLTLAWAGTLAVARGGWGLTTLTPHAVYVGAGTSVPTALGIGATNTVLHGNTGADPSFSAVVEGDLSLSDVTTGNVSTLKHGFVPKAPNDVTKYLDGTGAYSTPATGGTTTYTPGTTTIVTGTFLIMSNHLILTGVQRLTVQGTGRFRLTT
jgi:hypothetical protein